MATALLPARLPTPMGSAPHVPISFGVGGASSAAFSLELLKACAFGVVGGSSSAFDFTRLTTLSFAFGVVGGSHAAFDCDLQGPNLLTQIVTEVVGQAPSGSSRALLTQAVAELVRGPADNRARLSQAVVEVVAKYKKPGAYVDMAVPDDIGAFSW